MQSQCNTYYEIVARSSLSTGDRMTVKSQVEDRYIKTNTYKATNHTQRERALGHRTCLGGRCLCILRGTTKLIIHPDIVLKVKGGGTDPWDNGTLGLSGGSGGAWSFFHLSPHTWHLACSGFHLTSLSIVCHCAPYKVRVNSIAGAPVFFLESACLHALAQRNA